MNTSLESDSGLQQSSNWDNRKDTTFFMEEGFPYSEGFPKLPSGLIFDLILRDGEHRPAIVDFSTQYRTEGLKWRDLNGESINESIVIAWKEQSTSSETV